MEPLLQGAGGMLLVDPAFQRALVQVRDMGKGGACMGPRWDMGMHGA